MEKIKASLEKLVFSYFTTRKKKSYKNPLEICFAGLYAIFGKQVRKSLSEPCKYLQSKKYFFVSYEKMFVKPLNSAVVLTTLTTTTYILFYVSKKNTFFRLYESYLNFFLCFTLQE